MRELTITEALVELKTLDKRIDKAMRNGTFVTADKKTATSHNGLSRAEVETKIKAEYDSVVDLIKNRAAIKSAIVKSNAITEVEISGEKMTVAEAIERKTSIEYEMELLSVLKRHFSEATLAVHTANERIDNAIEKMTDGLSSSEKQNMATEQKALAEAYRTANEWELIDPLNIPDVMSKLDERIDSFLANVDTALSLSNAVTKITV